MGLCFIMLRVMKQLFARNNPLVSCVAFRILALSLFLSMAFVGEPVIVGDATDALMKVADPAFRFLLDDKKIPLEVQAKLFSLGYIDMLTFTCVCKKEEFLEFKKWCV